jgi:hypothetical protein
MSQNMMPNPLVNWSRRIKSRQTDYLERLAPMSVLVRKIVLLLLLPNFCYADWYEQGVAYKCSPDTGHFQLKSTINSSDPGANVAIQPDFSALPNGKSTVKCRLGKKQLIIQTAIYPPAEVGECAGTGLLYLTYVQLGTTILLPRPKTVQFNSGCFFRPTLVSIDIASSPNSKSTIETCYAAGWPGKDDGFYGVRCYATSISSSFSLLEHDILHSSGTPESGVR